jgi:hypothetical protein
MLARDDSIQGSSLEPAALEKCHFPFAAASNCAACKSPSLIILLCK